MIVATCFTNLDEYMGVEWPGGFAAPPRKGEWVQGRQGDKKPILTIINITHCWDGRAGEPYLRVELHK